MKAIKYVMLGVLTVGFSTTVMAQDGSKADVDAVKKIISSKPADLDKQMKPYYKANKKNVANLIEFGRAFYEAKDTANARVYANYALAASKNKCAPAYVLLGDIAALAEDGGAAAAYYDQAIYADNKFVDAYKRYAMVYSKIDPNGSARKLDELKANCPEVSIDAIKAHIYMRASERASDRQQVQENRKLAYEHYMKADIGQLDKGELNEFVRASYFTGHPQDAFRVAEAGLKLEPRNRTFNRMAMFSSYDMKNYDVAKAYINKYFNESDSVTASEYDYYYAALIYDALNERDNAKKAYHQALENVNEESMIKRWTILKTLSDSHIKENDFDTAIKYYQDYMGSKPELKIDDYEGLSEIYSKYAEATEEARKAELLGKAADVYSQIAEKYPVQKAYATYKRAELINKTDKDMAKRLAKNDYQQVVDLLIDKADRSKSENTMLKYGLHYLMFTSYLDKNIPAAKDYASKILVIDPEYKAALEIQNLK